MYFKNWRFFCVGPIGLLGGMWLFWNESSVKADIIKEDRYFIHANIVKAGKSQFLLTLVYASTIGNIRNKMSEDILNLQVDQSKA